MADKKITDLSLLSSPDATDVFAIVDIDASETKKTTLAVLQESIFNQNTGSFITNTDTGSFFKSASMSSEPGQDMNTQNLLFEIGNETTISVDMADFLVRGQSGSFFKSASIGGFSVSGSGGTDMGVSTYELNLLKGNEVTESISLRQFVTTAQSASYLVTSSLSDHTMTFTKGDGSTYDLTLPGGSGSGAFNTYLVPTIITGSMGDRTALTGSIYEDTSMFRLTWEGGNGIHQLILPDATSGTNAYRTIRFISDGTVTANDEFYLTCFLDQTLDGSSNPFQIDRSYEGIMVWSDGTEWFRIQTKA